MASASALGYFIALALSIFARLGLERIFLRGCHRGGDCLSVSWEKSRAERFGFDLVGLVDWAVLFWLDQFPIKKSLPMGEIK